MNLKIALLTQLLALVLAALPASGENSTSRDIVGASDPLPEATIFVAREVVTLDPGTSNANAITVVGDRILAA